MSCSRTAPALRGGASKSAYLRAAWLCALALYGCSSTPLVEALCEDEVDEDHDKLMDCDDPDCYASSVCRARPAQAKPPDDGGASSNDRDAEPAPTMDSGSMRPPMSVDPDAGPPTDSGTVMPPDDEDAGPDPCARCASDETCVDGRCRPAGAPTSGQYSLQVLRATVPAMDLYSRCYDACLIPAGLCMCFPDPYVNVILRRGGAEQLLGSTEIVMDDLEPSFPAKEIEFELAEGDVLRFDVIDDDPQGRDTLLYDCNADLSRVSPTEPMATELSCGITFQLGPLETRFRVTAMLTPLIPESVP